MSLYNRSSLIQVPSLYKDGTLVSTIPEDRSGDFTVARGSNLSATRVNKDGYIEKGYENLLLQSNSFDTLPWRNANAIPTSGQSGYDGSNNAWLLQANVTGQNFRYYDISVSSVYTISIYAKAGTTNWFFFYAVNGTGAWFDLGNGVVGTLNSGVVSSSIESVGDGWYRCSATYNGSLSSMRVYLSDGNNNVNATTGANIYIQDAMLNQGLVAYPYVETTTAPVAGGILEDMPRLDYHDPDSPNPKSFPALLLEPQRTNSLAQSEYFDGYYANFGGVSFDTNTSETLSPEGLYNATKLISSTNNTQQAIYKNITLATPTLTCYAKAAEYTSFTLKLSGAVACSFTLTGNGSTGYNPGVSAQSIEPVGNGWYKCSISATTNSVYAWISMSAGNLQGDGTSGIYIWGAQLEQGSYPTSYIPTYGTSQTRLGDSFQNDTNTSPLGTIGQGTWFVELQKLGDDLNQALYLAPTTSNAQQIRLHFDAQNARFRDARNGYLTIGGGVDIKTSMTKMALSIDTTSSIAKVYANGSQLGSDYTLQANPFEFSRIVAEGRGFILKQSLFFPTALSDDECIALTTIS